MSKTVFYQHKRLYFDRKSKKWSKERLYFDNGTHFVPGLASSATLTDDESEHDSANPLIADASVIQCDGDTDVG